MSASVKVQPELCNRQTACVTMDLQGLQLEVDGVTRSWADWTSHYVDSYYPRVGQDCYRVPAVHFNQQKLTRGDTSWGHTFHVLHPPDPAASVGDLGHTLVLERLDQLSQQLRDRDSHPLFIISSVNYDNYLARLQDSRKKQKKRKEKDISNTSREKVVESSYGKVESPTGKGDSLKDSDGKEGEGRQLKEISCGKVESPTGRGDSLKDSDGKESEGRQLKPPRPADRGNQRGEIDVLLLHVRFGVVLIEVKSTGHPDPTWSPTEEQLHTAIVRAVDKAAGQLTSGRDTVHYIMPDLHLQQVTLVVALPYVTRAQLMEALSTTPDSWPDLRFLCQDDLSPMATDAAAAATLPSHSTGRCSDQSRDCSPSLLAWWDGHMSAVDGALGLDTMRTIVGRICGLMSIVSVWTNSKPRVEVRTTSQAVGETGRRMSDIVLLPRQAALLAHPSLSRLYLTGPMGSGKTLLLQLKGRQWVREGRRVVVINVRATARGRPIGHVLEEALRSEVETHHRGSVDRHDVALDEFSINALQKELVAGVPMDDVCFIVDELLSSMSTIADQLTQQYPHSPIWCVASYVTPVPKTFRRVRLQAVLRSPPSVQLLLKELDLNPDHDHVYTTRSATRGLPCDGPPVIFIQHSKHHAPVRHLDCDQCAEELADIFEKKLGLKRRPPTLESEGQHTDHAGRRKARVARPTSRHSQSKKNKQKQTCTAKAVEAAPLSFRDILVVLAPPYATYKHVVDYHWEACVPEVLQYMMYMGTCRFLSGLKRRGVPFRVAVDNTLKEVAFPSKDEIIMTDIMGPHSLERKVVVFLRGGPPLTPAEIAENLSRYKTVQATAPLHESSGCEAGPETSSGNGQQAEGAPGGQKLTKDMMLFASVIHEMRDIVYPELSSCPGDGKAIIQRVLGNMVVARTQSFIEGKPKPRDKTPTEVPVVSSASQAEPLPLRLGMDLRAKLPMPGLSPSVDENEQYHEADNTSEDSFEGELEADSVFLVPYIHEDLGGREDEVRRLQQALAQLSEDDKDWEFFAASRCLSQYISILP